MRYTYRFKIVTAVPVLNRGCVFTGQFVVDKEMTGDEVFAFAISMNNSLKNKGSRLAEHHLVDVREG